MHLQGCEQGLISSYFDTYDLSYHIDIFIDATAQYASCNLIGVVNGISCIVLVAGVFLQCQASNAVISTGPGAGVTGTEYQCPREWGAALVPYHHLEDDSSPLHPANLIHRIDERDCEIRAMDLFLYSAPIQSQ